MKDIQDESEVKNEDAKMEVQNEEINPEESSHIEQDGNENVNDPERKENEEYYSPYLNESDSPTRSPLNVDQLPQVVITKKDPSTGDDDEDMEKPGEGHKNEGNEMQEMPGDNPSEKSMKNVMEPSTKPIPLIQPFNAQGMPPGLPMPFGMPPAMMRPPPGYTFSLDI